MLRPSIQNAIERIFKAATTATGGLAIGLGLLGGAEPATVQAADGKKPNIVMLMTDDTGWNDFGAYSAEARRSAIRPRTSIASPRKAPSSPVGTARQAARRAAPRS